MATKKEELTITPPNIKMAIFKIRGTAPYVQNRLSQQTIEELIRIQEAGGTAKKGKIRKPKDFNALYENAQYMSDDGWWGIPAPAFRNGLVSACRTAGFVMTRAKLSVFVEPDGFDKYDQTPLVKINSKKPERVVHPVRNETGVLDIRPRPMWKPGWQAEVKIRFDADQFTVEDVGNLLARVGLQVGIGEGRPDSKKSCGMGWGLFEIIN